VDESREAPLWISCSTVTVECSGWLGTFPSAICSAFPPIRCLSPRVQLRQSPIPPRRFSTTPFFAPLGSCFLESSVASTMERTGSEVQKSWISLTGRNVSRLPRGMVILPQEKGAMGFVPWPKLGPGSKWGATPSGRIGFHILTSVSV
jgi:hypothetical protein